MRNALKITIAIVFLAAPTVALATTAAGGGKPLAINCDQEQYKPKTIVLACGDGGNWLGKLKWSHWGKLTARGAGRYKANNCTPDCAAGHIESYAVTVTLSKPKRCPGQATLGFKQAELSFTSTSPKDAPGKLRFRCPPQLPGEY